MSVLIPSSTYFNAGTFSSNSATAFLLQISSTYSPTTIATATGTTQTAILLEIYSGTKPADFSAFTNVSSVAANLLITFNCGAATANGSVYEDLSTTSYLRYRVGKSLGAATLATASGTASWFLLRRNPSGTGDIVANGAIMGTVGATGSGADMEIDTTSIVSGSSYRSNGFVINFPLVAMTV